LAFTYVDLFSGCGGLSLGIESSGGKLILAVEKSAMAAETFSFNLLPNIAVNDWSAYCESPSLFQIESGLLVKPISDLLAEPRKLRELRLGGIDAVVGGPPCQGFSLAGRRNQSDERNILPWQFLEVVEALNPKIVVIENVVGMRHNFKGGKHSPFDELAVALGASGEGYVVQKVMANALHYGAAQSRPRLLLIGLRSDLANQKNVVVDQKIWESNFKDKMDEAVPMLAPPPTTTFAGQHTVRNALSDLLGAGQTDFLKKLNRSFPFLPQRRGLKNNEKRNHTDRSKTRFALYHLLAMNSLPLGLINYNGRTLAFNAEMLLDLFNEFKTHKQSQRVVQLDRPSPTILTSADDFIHPIEERVFSVRELARMQGFPDDFQFQSKATTGGLNRRYEVPQYSQVGNAVSPFLSKEIGHLINRVLQ
jgi:DNA (cytosine-5)-methyltransferase 1